MEKLSWPGLERRSCWRLLVVAVAALLSIPAPASGADYLGSVGETFGPGGRTPGLFPDAPVEPNHEVTNSVSLAVDTEGSVYALQDTLVRKFDGGGELLASWDTAQFGVGSVKWQPGRLAAGPDAIYVTDPEHGRVVRLSSSGQLVTTFSGLGDGPGGSPGEGLCPSSVATDPHGNIYTSRGRNGRWAKLSPSGNPLVAGVACLGGPIAAAPDGSVYLITCESIKRVLEYGPDGRFVRLIGRPRLEGGPRYAPEGEFGPYPVGGGQFGGASGLTVAADGVLWVADPDNERFQGFRADGSVVAVCYPRALGRVGAITTGPGASLYATDHGRIQRFAPTTNRSAICDSRWRALALRANRLRLARGHFVSVRLRCRGVVDDCRGIVTITTPARRLPGRSLKPIRLGRGRFRLEVGRARLVSVRLSKTGEAIARRHRRTRVQVKAVGRTPAGLTYSQSSRALLTSDGRSRSAVRR